jgi:glutathione synthase/RimK-type ligase-like ATP-grasp enzyme
MQEIEMTETQIARALHARGIEVMDDPRNMRDIGRAFGIIPVAAEVEVVPTEPGELEV